jgi:hypothetical protein
MILWGGSGEMVAAGMAELPAWLAGCSGSSVVAVSGSGGQVRSGCGRAARRAKAAASSCRQGQCPAMRTKTRRPPRVMRAATCSSRVAQRFRFGLGQYAVQQGGLGPGDHVRGGPRQFEPGGVDVELTGGHRPRQVSLPRRMWSSTLACPDGLQGGDLPDVGVGGEGLESPAAHVG